MKSHMLLLREVLEESGTRCCTSTTRDLETITRRVEHEGLSYLTITLPLFCEDLQKGLSNGAVDSTLFVGYSKKGCLPKFLWGFTSRVFDSGTGQLLDDPDIDAIRSIRQISLLHGKIELPCSDARVRAAMSKYIECESEVRRFDNTVSQSDLDRFASMSIRIWGGVLGHVDRQVYNGELIPKHGPGSTADGLAGNGKYNQHSWTQRLEDGGFPHGEFLFTSWSHFLDSPDVPLLEPGAEIPVKVITVPKTLKTPRIIAVEPTCMQYAQQALLQSLVPAIAGRVVLGRMVGFRRQEPNQLLAREGSWKGHLATLDLSEASDRVSNQLVRRMLAPFPHLSMAVDACRSRKADVPGYGVIRLAKFASMGSALCFPIEAMVFTTLVFLGIEAELSYQLTEKRLSAFARRVRIYGDDIVVPVEHVRSVVETLETFGSKVNLSKSFWTGKFRESCGKEYYDGEDVSIVRVRAMLPTTRKQVPELVSTVSLRNQLYLAGWWKVVKTLDDMIEGLIPFPYVSPTSPALGRHSFLGYDSEKECPNLQRPLVKAYVVTPLLPRDVLEGHGALLKVFLNQGEPFVDEKHLERAGRPKAVNIKLRWVSAS